jgi:hypothetical protein
VSAGNDRINADLARYQLRRRPRPRRRCTSFDFEDEDDLIKIDAQYTLSVICYLFSET